ncbi:diaminopimelate decarboxylase [Arenicella chitinivorans]|uniref:Diaminopimelate decarboxylase n=1 Tax=Arenicella chitinivorans TaxID=1329800 RepID=A0A918RR43_9GAMM|nr:diaminopimelate decarboxylase [Arenicella chitinivorans]GHA09979.1 diaminopimelate decarboxylase [Arenicella chitinivorans]
MTFFAYHAGELYAEQVPLSRVAQQVGTPAYVYSRAAIENQWRALDDAFGDYPHTICYAVKANSNIAILNLLARLGSGFDIVSEGELRRVLAAGGDPSKVVYSGVAKSVHELEFALKSNVRSINIESVAELHRLQAVAASLGVTASIAIRVNPDVDPETHPYISTGMEKAKFGVTMEAAFEAYKLAHTMPNIEVHGIACHIGSQITKTSPFTDALEIVLNMVKRLAQAGIQIQQLDLGGGLGINYQGETPPAADEYVQAMIAGVAAHGIDLPIAIEPGRYIAGNSGVMLTTVEYTKHNTSKNFAIVDAGMNDLMRPALYQAHHEIIPVRTDSSAEPVSYDVVGPVCESADVLGYERELALQSGDLLAVCSAGAYSFAMSNNYNSRTRPPEVMVDGDQIHVIRRRETFDQLIQGERQLPD